MNETGNEAVANVYQYWRRKTSFICWPVVGCSSQLHTPSPANGIDTQLHEYGRCMGAGL